MLSLMHHRLVTQYVQKVYTLSLPPPKKVPAEGQLYFATCQQPKISQTVLHRLLTEHMSKRLRKN